MLIASGLAVVPLTGLIFLWGGLSPDNAWRVMYLEDGFTFHVNYLVLYIGLMFVYLFPFVIWNWKKIYNKKITVITSMILSIMYWLFPVGPSKYDLANNTQTVGLFNKLLVWINPAEWFDQTVFYICFMLGLPVLITIVTSIWSKVKQKKVDFAVLLDLSVASFLVIMPFSYLGWEKYFVPLVPILILRLLLLNNRSVKY
jgi:hypothetical protein